MPLLHEHRFLVTVVLRFWVTSEALISLLFLLTYKGPSRPHSPMYVSVEMCGLKSRHVGSRCPSASRDYTPAYFLHIGVATHPIV